MKDYKNILVVRTDRIGDVVLSTPVIESLRLAFPKAKIAMMVSPETAPIVRGNPFLNDVIIFDKEKEHHGLIGTLALAGALRKKSFDLALILHPTNRVHILAALAGIPERVGYNRKLDFLLTRRVKHLKQLGEKHELEYNFDILESVGIPALAKRLYVPLEREEIDRGRRIIAEHGIKQGEEFFVLHPSASDISRRWPAERFAEVGDRLMHEFKMKAVIVAGPEDVDYGIKVEKTMENRPVDLSGELSLKELTAVIKLSALLISNISGPVHLACAVGTPCVALFSYKQKGLSPKRWGPLGKHVTVIHKDAGCIECLAHDCKKGFLCLSLITPDEVVEKARLLLSLKRA